MFPSPRALRTAAWLAPAAALAALALGPPAPVPAAAPATAAAPLVWVDLDGRGYGPVYLRGQAATVFVFASAECPLASAYASRLRDLEREFFPRRVGFFLADAHPTDSPDRLRAWAADRGLNLPLVKDAGGLLAARLGATRTPEAVVVDRAGRVLYRGRIDDGGKDPARTRRRFLREALEAALAGKTVEVASRPVADGCLILRSAATRPSAKAAAAGAPTWARDIAPIVNRSCVPCHRKGEVAPFALDAYAQAKLWAPMLADVTRRRVMPPFQAAPGHGDFVNALGLSDAEVKTIGRWAAAGAPAGDLRKAPPAPRFAPGWQAGKPDVVVAMSAPHRAAGEGADSYRCFVLPTEFRRDAWVTLAQVAPGNRAAVHHVIVYVDPSGTRALAADAADGTPGDGFDNPRAGAGPPVDGAYWLVAWAPGSPARRLPEGQAIPVPRGARLVMEVHYHPTGRPETDRTSVGITFAREPVRQIPRLVTLAQFAIAVPPGAARHAVSAQLTLDRDVVLHSIAPHMHQIGRQMRVWAEKPDGGGREELIWVKDWDFNWQQSYVYRRPLSLPKGTVLKMRATYDNSEKNPRNPSRPPRWVRWGEASTDEMCMAFLGVSHPEERLSIWPGPWREAVALLPAPPDPRPGRAGTAQDSSGSR